VNARVNVNVNVNVSASAIVIVICCVIVSVITANAIVSCNYRHRHHRHRHLHPGRIYGNSIEVVCDRRRGHAMMDHPPRHRRLVISWFHRLRCQLLAVEVENESENEVAIQVVRATWHRPYHRISAPGYSGTRPPFVACRLSLLIYSIPFFSLYDYY
jgi:hypothetical protein